MDDLSIDDAVNAMLGDNLETDDTITDVDSVEYEDFSEESPDDLQDDIEETPEEASGDDVDDDDVNDGPEEVTEVPEFWDNESKERFKQWSPEVREEILKYDRQARAAVSKHIQNAAEVRKVAEAEANVFRQEHAKIKEVIDSASLTLVDKYANIDWEAYMERDPQNAVRHLKQRNEDMQKFTAIRNAWEKSQEAVRVAEAKEFLSNEQVKLEQLASTDADAKKLVDPVHGPAEKLEVAKYLVALGVPAEDLNHIGAIAMTVAQKAMLYDKGRKVIAEKKSSPQNKTQNSVRMRPSTRQGTINHSKKATQRLERTGSVDDAVAALLALEKK